MSPRTLATLTGLTAVLMWAALGLMTAASGRVPAFQMNAMAFGISGVTASVWLAVTGRLAVLRQPLPVWALGVGGLFGFHALYFTSLRLAPPVEANLVNYTWPLLIVVFSGLLPGERLRPHHVIGALLGLLGAAAIVTRGEGLNIDPAHAGGYLAACASAPCRPPPSPASASPPPSSRCPATSPSRRRFGRRVRRNGRRWSASGSSPSASPSSSGITG